MISSSGFIPHSFVLPRSPLTGWYLSSWVLGPCVQDYTPSHYVCNIDTSKRFLRLFFCPCLGLKCSRIARSLVRSVYHCHCYSVHVVLFSSGSKCSSTFHCRFAPCRKARQTFSYFYCLIRSPNIEIQFLKLKHKTYKF